jgi:hypothetical protein
MEGGLAHDLGVGDKATSVAHAEEAGVPVCGDTDGIVGPECW